MTGKDNDELSRSIRSSFELKTTEELGKILKEKDRDQWTDQAFDIIQEILEERKDEIPEQEVQDTCFKCGTDVVLDAKFCFKCGEYLSDNCMICDKPIPDESKYCPYCGSNIKKQTHAKKIPSMDALLNTTRVGLIVIVSLIMLIGYLLTQNLYRISALLLYLGTFR